MKTVRIALALAAALFAAPAMAEVQGPVLVVTHVDFIPTNLAVGLPALQLFAQQSRSDPGVRSFTLITWAPTTNHFQLIEVFDSIAAFNSHVQAPHTIAFRAAIQAAIGALYDERLYSLSGAPGQP